MTAFRFLGCRKPSSLPRVRDAFMSLMREVEEMRRELQAARERLATLERLADRDPLVPIANRRAFVRELSCQMAHAERYGHTPSVVYIDLNDFKEINDTFGHAAGDEALRHVASILLQNVRVSDIVGRLGGDEFGIILDQTGARESRGALRAHLQYAASVQRAQRCDPGCRRRPFLQRERGCRSRARRCRPRHVCAQEGA
ncbi:MAG: GGDEF domain-containing protein [Alphaproteobacteria bacterium]|nr:GGDEF domain-containing protein [Alphaproteobacteria bacterium]